MRISGQIGNWPVDLELKLNSEELRLVVALLGGSHPQGECPPPAEVVAPAEPARPSSRGDKLWELAQECLRRGGEVEGPSLLADLSALAGSEQDGKRLLVRLRHLPQVQMESRGATSIYRWSDQ